jgi:hypothetical protein
MTPKIEGYIGCKNCETVLFRLESVPATNPGVRMHNKVKMDGIDIADGALHCPVPGVGGGQRIWQNRASLRRSWRSPPASLPNDFRADLLPKFRGPVTCRMVVESLTTTLEQAILPKLQWWKWSGVDAPAASAAIGAGFRRTA